MQTDAQLHSTWTDLPTATLVTNWKYIQAAVFNPYSARTPSMILAGNKQKDIIFAGNKQKDTRWENIRGLTGGTQA